MTSQQTSSTKPAPLCRSTFMMLLTLGWMRKPSGPPSHPHLGARETYVEADGLVQAAPVPRFSRTLGAIRRTQPDGYEVIARWRDQ